MQIHRRPIAAIAIPTRSALPPDIAPLRVPAKPSRVPLPRWWFVLVRGVGPHPALLAAH